ncbi:MAG: hypothetical protein UT58_C0029G0003 [Microgenomates group bacterium GW2011_GWC1_39_7b]|nr:MAG: hypothetical protein UT58_C0029G0003 [Microgenomates group bacterium GW2011_GWC1_39_7b]KKT74071.1 MAG: Glycosyl transferase, group 1 [Microgenomates group bacterium GW2011_GWA2_44_7]
MAIVYDWVDKFGGAEQLLLSLHRLFPKAPLFTTIYNRKNSPWANCFKVIPSWLDKLPWPKKHELLTPILPLAVESLDFSDFNVVISVSSSFAKGIITQPNTLHICYCLSPTRFLWQDRLLYEGRLPMVVKELAKPIFFYLREWDKIAAHRPDYFVAISKYVAQGISQTYHRNVIEVIYPPIANANNDSLIKTSNKKKNYFLIVSRLVPYKRVDIVIKAFSQLNFRLKIVGSGMEMSTLKQIAGDNIEFLGKVSEPEKTILYAGAIAVIIPQREDFGLVGLEANSYGIPVLAFAAGGNLETVIDGVTGRFFSSQTPEAIAQAIISTDFSQYLSLNCKKHAQAFSYANFNKKWRDILKGIPQ